MYDYYPLGKYWYKRLPKGVANSQAIFQQKMNDLFHIFEFIFAYIDDMLISPRGDWTDHLQKLELTLNKLKEKNLNVILKSHSLDKPKWNILVSG